MASLEKEKKYNWMWRRLYNVRINWKLTHFKYIFQEYHLSSCVTCDAERLVRRAYRRTAGETLSSVAGFWDETVPRKIKVSQSGINPSCRGVSWLLRRGWRGRAPGTVLCVCRRTVDGYHLPDNTRSAALKLATTIDATSCYDFQNKTNSGTQTFHFAR